MEDGAEVEAGAPLIVLEAMKMEHAVRNSKAGLRKAFNALTVRYHAAFLA